jgi:glycosyltransferase involved in cell wall biosynthesis
MRNIAYLSGAVRVTTDPAGPAGGPRSHVVGVIEALRAAGHDVDAYIAGDRPWAKRLAGGGREDAVRTAPWRAYAADAVRLSTGGWNRLAAPQAIAGAVDLAYERFGSFQSIGRGFQRRGATWVLETSGPFFHEAKAERGTLALTALARRTELAAYDRCDLLVCVSETLRSWLVDVGVRADHIYVMPNGVDVRRFDPARVPTPCRPSELVIGFVGTVLAWQGLASVVEAMAVARERGTDVRFVIVGDGPALPEVRATAARLGVDDVVTCTGQLPAEEIPSRIRTFDLGVSGHLPLLDGQMYHSPLKLYEYLAMGVPLLAADHPEARSLVEAVGVGHLFPPGDIGALAVRLEEAAQELSTIRSAATSSAVRSFAVDHHSWDERVAGLLAELERRSR